MHMRPLAIVFFLLEVISGQRPDAETLAAGMDELFGVGISSNNLITCSNSTILPCIDANGRVLYDLGKAYPSIPNNGLVLGKRDAWYQIVGNSGECVNEAIKAWNEAYQQCWVRSRTGSWYRDRPCVTSLISMAILTATSAAKIAMGVVSNHGSRRDMVLYDLQSSYADATFTISAPSEVMNGAVYHRSTAGGYNYTVEAKYNGTIAFVADVLVADGDANTTFRFTSWEHRHEPNSDLTARQADAYDGYFSGSMGLKMSWCHTSSSHYTNINNDWDSMWAAIDNDMQYIGRCWTYDIGVVDMNDRPRGWPVLMSSGFLVLETRDFGDNTEGCHKEVFDSIAQDDWGDEL